METQILERLCCSSSSGISLKQSVATESKASSGHSENQSIVQQLTSEGNIRQRPLKIESFCTAFLKVPQEVVCIARRQTI